MLKLELTENCGRALEKTKENAKIRANDKHT